MACRLTGFFEVLETTLHAPSARRPSSSQNPEADDLPYAPRRTHRNTPHSKRNRLTGIPGSSTLCEASIGSIWSSGECSSILPVPSYRRIVSLALMRQASTRITHRSITRSEEVDDPVAESHAVGRYESDDPQSTGDDQNTRHVDHSIAHQTNGIPTM